MTWAKYCLYMLIKDSHIYIIFLFFRTRQPNFLIWNRMTRYKVLSCILQTNTLFYHLVKKSTLEDPIERYWSLLAIDEMEYEEVKYGFGWGWCYYCCYIGEIDGISWGGYYYLYINSEKCTLTVLINDMTDSNIK